MVSNDHFELSGQRPGCNLPACSCGTTRHNTPLPGDRMRMLSSLATAVFVAILPKCPMCLLAYVSILSSLGITSAANTALYMAWLQPISILFLGLTVFLIAFRAHQRRGYGPALTATVAGAVILLGKFRLDSLPAMYIGLLLMFVAVLWNAWPKKNR